MFNHRKILISAILVLTITVICSCASQTPLQTFAIADEEYINTLETYNRHYDMQDEATQQEWDKKFRPIIKRASKALDAWKMALYYNSSDVAQKQKIYMEVKNQLLLILSDVLVKGE